MTINFKANSKIIREINYYNDGESEIFKGFVLNNIPFLFENGFNVVYDDDEIVIYQYDKYVLAISTQFITQYDLLKW